MIAKGKAVMTEATAEDVVQLTLNAERIAIEGATAADLGLSDSSPAYRAARDLAGDKAFQEATGRRGGPDTKAQTEAAIGYARKIPEVAARELAAGGMTLDGMRGFVSNARARAAEARGRKGEVPEDVPAMQRDAVAAAFDYGTVPVGSASQAQTFTVSNTGIAVLTVSAATVVGTDGSQFSIQGNTCVAQVIRPSGTCAVSVAFSPASSGGKSAALRIASNDPDSPSIDIPLTGSGTMQQHTLTVSKTVNGVVTSTPAGISCGAACSGLYNAGATVTLTATPSSDYTFDGWSGGTCTGTGTCVITLNASAGVTATFKS